MKDRFKFRIPMFTDKDNFQEFQYLELGEQEECTLCGYNGEPQQCTGLKDKNGKLVYESDIITDRIDKYVVEWDIDEAYLRFWVREIGTRDYYTFEQLLSYEVIGNIYENPELLED